MVSELIESMLRSLNDETLRNLDAAKAIEHPGEGGRAREGILAAALRRLLPNAFQV